MIRQGLSFVALFLAVLSAGLQAQFARTYGGQGSDEAARIMTTLDGGFIVFGNSASFGGKAWLVKLAADGQVQWEKAYKVPSSDPLCSVCGTPEGGYLIVGGTNSSLWLMKINSLGEAEWQKTIANMAPHGIFPYGVCPAVGSGYFIIGYTELSEKYFAWVIKLSFDGNLIWQKGHSLGYWEVGVCAEMAADGGCIIAGTTNATLSGREELFVFKIDALGAVVWQKKYSAGPAVSIRRTIEGGYVLVGSNFVLKISESGVVEWAKSFHPFRQGRGLSDIWLTQDGGSIVTGSPGSGEWSDILVMKLQPNGDIEWQKAFGGFFAESGSSVVQTRGGDYAVAGYTTSFGAGSRDVCVLRLSPEGELGTGRFCSRSPRLLAAPLDVSQAAADLSIKDTSAAPRTANFEAQDTRGTSQTYQICTVMKLLTISAKESIAASSITPQLGTHLYSAGDSVSISAAASVTIGGSIYNFSEWDGDVTGTSNPITFTITDDTSVRANYLMEWGGDGGGGGGKKPECFIATAAFRSPLHPAVKLLRDFRDRRLLTNRIGRALVAFYYRWSPSAARKISRSAWLRLVARIFLVPIMGAAFLVLKLGWPASFLLLAVALAFAFRKVRRRCAA